MWLKILLVSVVCFLVNIPMGMMRERAKKFSLAWIFWVHASIPLIIGLRIGLHLYPVAIPINIAAAIMGQMLGALPEKKRRRLAAPPSLG